MEDFCHRPTDDSLSVVFRFHLDSGLRQQGRDLVKQAPGRPGPGVAVLADMAQAFDKASSSSGVSMVGGSTRGERRM